MTTQLYDLGQFVAKLGALEALRAVGQAPGEFISRQAASDWGDLDEHDRRENERSMNDGFRIRSAYRFKNGVKIWIIIEADRSSTTLLLPEEY